MPQRKTSEPLKAWVAALKKHGFMKSGEFKPVPKKGTCGYNKVRATQLEMLEKTKKKKKCACPGRKK